MAVVNRRTFLAALAAVVVAPIAVKHCPPPLTGADWPAGQPFDHMLDANRYLVAGRRSGKTRALMAHVRITAAELEAARNRPPGETWRLELLSAQQSWERELAFFTQIRKTSALP